GIGREAEDAVPAGVQSGHKGRPGRRRQRRYRRRQRPERSLLGQRGESGKATLLEQAGDEVIVRPVHADAQHPHAREYALRRSDPGVGMPEDDDELAAARRRAMTAILGEIERRLRTGEATSGPPLPILTLAEAYAWL